MDEHDDEFKGPLTHEEMEVTLHMFEFVEAVSIFKQRQASYGDAWKQYGAVANLLKAATKMDRLMEIWWFNPDGAKALKKDALDDAYDLLNYAVFFIRLAREGNFIGDPPSRPLPPFKYDPHKFGAELS